MLRSSRSGLWPSLPAASPDRFRAAAAGAVAAAAYHAGMPERLTSDDVAHVARLARLTITPDELELFTSQLGKILDHANQMATLDLNGIEPTPHPYPLRNVMREDELVPTLDRDEVLAAAPSAQDGMFRVPPVLGEEP